MILIACAKINPYLHVLGKRPDGYHDLDLEFQSVSLADELTITELPRDIEVICTPTATAKAEDNIACKTALLIKERTNCAKGARISIVKTIPVGAGLAGGSADAAAVLLGLNELWSLNLTLPELTRISTELGSDIAFCLTGGRARGTGRGTELTKLPDLEKQWLVLAKPDFSISTAWAYKTFSTDKCPTELANHLESVVLPQYPQIEEIKAELLALGAVKALMSGSGSAVFGLMPDQRTAEDVLAKLSSASWKRVCHTVDYGVEMNR
ncbi:MAG: 4-(cytidine 5'-diphospho)-2-C-methyl-D-erythritol kinase [Candidatus Margulisiibacteriota bacterium]